MGIKKRKKWNFYKLKQKKALNAQNANLGKFVFMDLAINPTEFPLRWISIVKIVNIIGQ